MVHRLDHNGLPVVDMLEDKMDYYFVVDDSTDLVESIVQRTKGKPLGLVAGKSFVLADGVALTFYMRLKLERDNVTLSDVKNY